MRQTSSSDRSGSYFFLSYAHTPKHDPGAPHVDPWVAKLFHGLSAHIMQMTSLPVGTRAGFMDQELTVGQAWPERLSRELAFCRVFVPLYSPRYFTSEVCGREWYAFAQRATIHNARYRTAVSPIVPALWVPVEPSHLPEAARSVQFSHPDFGEDYAAEGFYGLSKLTYLRDEYERAVYRLAQRIVHVAQETHIAPSTPLEYADLPSAFDRPSGSQTLSIVVAATRRGRLPEGRSDSPYGSSYGNQARDWNPYHPDTARPLAEVAADLAHNQGLRARVDSFDEVADTILAGEHHSDGPVLLIIDPWALRDPDLLEKLLLLDAAASPWTRVVVPWNRQDPDNAGDIAPEPGDLESVIPQLLKLGRAASRASVSGVGTLEAFCEIVALAVRHASADFDRHAPAYPPSGPPPPRPSPFGPSDPEAPGDRSS
ncbi:MULTISPECIES: TIR-like protein FxsC [unclassified Streptomyces]|uniref:TIR-like protein FxsC n=1 Tax=unclassified Streptomyces TaxID=2593676 RepID=UPI002DD9FBC5|nr:TIR-like protein FxsC [Streptomyces sp. NBC_00243]WRZ22918.1 TIR-like protein FxsC [Streptomyces sp. NBC_00243]